VKPGDIVSILYETKRCYIILEELGHHDRGFSETQFRLFGLKDGTERIVNYSEIKMISEA